MFSRPRLATTKSGHMGIIPAPQFICRDGSFDSHCQLVWHGIAMSIRTIYTADTLERRTFCLSADFIDRKQLYSLVTQNNPVGADKTA